ncbi:MAG: hypothetical protein OM95_13860 [Bdellovibrio sp. ArHS]|uniref:hypothetical protein n=1 Tax=Bdellovibrio sp. ArHS TaxID=1569284 RepID=UPI000582D985|nr:hypothetical protein [Bdellovibrio sp. ArHS]KHD87528.1 MAG: hypothetical protein OM95_13860 [Bdellovibrio sp. ArHS]
MRLLILLLPLFLVTACSTTSKKETSQTVPVEATEAEETSAVDYLAIQRHLQLERDRDALGFSEKAFNTCATGYGYSRSQNCHQEHLVVIHFRLLCRDSEGTISTILSEADLQPLASRRVRWSLKGLQGETTTDSLGYGQIVTAAIPSQRTQRLRLAVGSEFLYMRAGEIQKVITPQPWCDSY